MPKPQYQKILFPKNSQLERLPLYDAHSKHLVKQHREHTTLSIGSYTFKRYFYASNQLSNKRYNKKHQYSYKTILTRPPIAQTPNVIALSEIPAPFRSTGFFFRADTRNPTNIYHHDGFWARCVQISKQYDNSVVFNQAFILRHVNGSNDCVSTSRSPFQSRNGFEKENDDGYCYLYCIYVFCGISIQHYLKQSSIDQYWHENEISILAGVPFDHIVGFARYPSDNSQNREIFLSQHWFHSMEEQERRSIFAFLTGCIPMYPSIRYHSSLIEKMD